MTCMLGKNALWPSSQQFKIVFRVLRENFPASKDPCCECVLVCGCWVLRNWTLTVNLDQNALSQLPGKDSFNSEVNANHTINLAITRGKLRVQFANIRKMVLCEGLPHFLRSVYWPMHGTLSYGNGRKNTKCDQFFCPTSDFFDFCNPCFFYHTFIIPMMQILLTKLMQKSVITACLHCSFALWKINI